MNSKSQEITSDNSANQNDARSESPILRDLDSYFAHLKIKQEAEDKAVKATIELAMTGSVTI